MDYCLFSMGFNLANMTCQLVELGSFNPVFAYFYQLERQISINEVAKSRDGVFKVIIAIIYTPWLTTLVTLIRDPLVGTKQD